MKKKIATIFCTALVCATMSIALSACDLGNGNGNGGSSSGTPDKGAAQVMTTSELVGFSAATSANVLSAIAPNAGTAAEGATNVPTDDEKALVEKINEQIKFLENFVSENPVTVTNGVSDRQEYQKMMTVTTIDLNGNNVIYVMYFNETLQIEDEDEDENEAVSTSELDDEQEFALTGIMVAGDKEYLLEGEKELEEDEYEFSMKASIDSDNYVKFKQEIENDEQEFRYTVFKDGAKVKDFAIEIEDEDGEQIVNLKDSNANGIKTRYIRKTENGKTFIKVDITENGVKNSVKVFSVINTETGAKGYRYLLNSGKEIVIYDSIPETPVTPEVPVTPETPVTPEV